MESDTAGISSGPRHHWQSIASPLVVVLSMGFWFRFMFPPRCASANSAGWLALSFLSAVVAAGLGHSARKNIRKGHGRFRGQWTAMGGLILAYSLILGFLTGFLTPAIYRSHQAANESLAVASLRKIAIAEKTYAAAHEERSGLMSELIAAGLLDSSFHGPVRCYDLDVTTSGTLYEATAVPISRDAGRFGYYSAPDGVVRYSTTMSLAPSGLSGLPVQ